ncbi:hypothetical protein RN001_010001 [Aquatica leii]|uniref:Uncharacterized protein n=1 Tax=Aquatica leii TaxID=1421715 RepID=A0AAN7P0A8_9COLE|nr:hypothetical protein RN001_010001 [Aquatica leii]
MRQLVFVVLLPFILCKSSHNARQARWFGRTYTETKIQTDTVTSIMPSSCVHVEATLPPCRGLRNLQSFPEFIGREVYPNHLKGRQLVEQPKIISKNQSQVVLAPVNETKVVGWAEYLGLVGPTITVTEIHFKTTTVIDPRTMVTFSVKGCKPSRLPMDLDRCPVSSQYSVDEIVPANVLSLIVPTAVANELSFNNVKRSKDIDLEPSSPSIAESLPMTATEDLSNIESSDEEENTDNCSLRSTSEDGSITEFLMELEEQRKEEQSFKSVVEKEVGD